MRDTECFTKHAHPFSFLQKHSYSKSVFLKFLNIYGDHNICFLVQLKERFGGPHL